MENRDDKIEMFIEMRARGNSFDRIAKTINVSKSTLIAWSKQYKLDLQNYKNIKADALLDKYKMTKQHQLESLGEQLEKIRNEIKKRDLSDIPTSKLLDMEVKVLETINNNDCIKIGFTENSGGMTPIEFTTSWEA